MTIRQKMLLGALCAGAWIVPAAATPPANISQTVGVCDPWFPQNCLAPTSGGALPVAPAASPSSQTNSASTITTGGTFQTIALADTARKSFDFQNLCSKTGNCTATSNNCYLFIAGSGSPTLATAILVAAGQEYLRSAGAIPSDAIQATCDGNGDKFYLAVQ